MSRLVYDNLMKFPLFVMGRIDKNPTEERERSCNLRQSNDRNMMTALFFTLISESTDTSQLDRHTECQHKTSPLQIQIRNRCQVKSDCSAAGCGATGVTTASISAYPTTIPGKALPCSNQDANEIRGYTKSQYNDGKRNKRRILKKYPWKTTSDIKDRIPLNPHLPVIYKFENLP